jgi:ADP-ribose pyrophosphatase
MAADDQSVKLRSRKKLCENEVFNVYLDDLVETDGSEIRNYLVVEPRLRTADLVTGVSVLPVLDGLIGLLQVYRHAIGRPVWEVPRGFVGAAESDEESAARELEEETGLGIHAGTLRSAGFIAPEAGLIAGRIHVFIAQQCFRKRAYATSEFGHREMRWFSPEDMAGMVESSEIEDPSTLVAFYRFAHASRTRPENPRAHGSP